MDKIFIETSIDKLPQDMKNIIGGYVDFNIQWWYNRMNYYFFQLPNLQQPWFTNIDQLEAEWTTIPYVYLCYLLNTSYHMPLIIGFNANCPKPSH